MALRGDKLTLRAQQHSSGTNDAIIAESTSVSIDFSAEFLPTTSQTDALNQTGIAGMVSGTASGDYLYASDGVQFTNFLNKMNAGEKISVEVYRDSTKILDGEGVFTNLNLGGGLSDSLVTGSYTIQFSGNMAV